MGLADQANWRYYDAGDAPEGAYMNWLWEGTTSLTGTIPLGRSFEPGTEQCQQW